MDVLRMAWLKSQVDADAKEKFDQTLAFVEHLASFINPEGVKQVQGSRKNAVRVTDDSFLRTVAALSGSDAAQQIGKTMKK